MCFGTERKETDCNDTAKPLVLKQWLVGLRRFFQTQHWPKAWGECPNISVLALLVAELLDQVVLLVPSHPTIWIANVDEFVLRNWSVTLCQDHWDINVEIFSLSLTEFGHSQQLHVHSQPFLFWTSFTDLLWNNSKWVFFFLKFWCVFISYFRKWRAAHRVRGTFQPIHHGRRLLDVIPDLHQSADHLCAVWLQSQRKMFRCYLCVQFWWLWHGSLCLGLALNSKFSISNDCADVCQKKRSISTKHKPLLPCWCFCCLCCRHHLKPASRFWCL